MKFRDKSGVFRKSGHKQTVSKVGKNVIVEHNYANSHICDGLPCKSKCNRIEELGRGVIRDGWRVGRRVVELGILMDNLKYCSQCKLGPVPLTAYNIVGELQKGLSGYLYVVCQNADCQHVNRVAYGKQHHSKGKAKGMPCFDVNTKLGTAMIDSLGGPVRVNNFLSTLNMKPIGNKNLKKMEVRAGEAIQSLSINSAHEAARGAFEKEMEDITRDETARAKASMEGPLVDDLGISFLPDESPSVKLRLQVVTDTESDSWTDVESDDEAAVAQDDLSFLSLESPAGCSQRTQANKALPQVVQRSHKSATGHSAMKSTSRTSLVKKFPSKTRTGMSCAIDTAWQKKGFDSLISHTFLMSKAKYGKKVVKSIVSHRTCGTCNWWRRNRPGEQVRSHMCVRNHSGSAMLMQSVSGEKAVLEMNEEGTNVEYLEGDGDNTLIARLRDKSNIHMKKRFDRNHIVKNVGKSLYALHHQKGVKLSKLVILHLEKCLKCEKENLRENLKALVPHQFGDHSFCNARFCVMKRKPGELYIHKSLPYKTALKDTNLRVELQKIFDPLVANASQYADLGSSQQCEHANKEVSLRAPKSHHYGNSKSLDYRVHGTAAFINEGRHYVSKTNELLQLSPGAHTMKYAHQCQKRRLKKQQFQQLPSVKRRRLILKQERATSQGAMESLEGVSYQSGIGHSSEVDTERLPEAVPRGNFQPVRIVEGDPTFIAFDLETTDLIRGSVMPQITQIAAVNTRSGARFSVYSKPQIPIAPEAQRITGIGIDSDTGEMSLNGVSVPSVNIKCAFEKLCSWLSAFSNVYLVAHNGRRFDFPVLMSAMQKTGMTYTIFSCVRGCVDTMPLFKKRFPGQSLKQVDLALFNLGTSYAAHNAEADVEILGKLMALCADSEVLSFSFSLSAVNNCLHLMLLKPKIL